MHERATATGTARPGRDLAALAFALLFPLLMAWLYFVVLPGQGQRDNPAVIAAYSAGKLVQLLFPVLYVAWVARDQLRPAWPTTRGLGLGVGFAALVAAALFGLYFGWLADSPLLADTPGRIYARLREFGRATPGGFLLAALFLCVLHALFEEYYWRWFAFGWLKRYLPLAGAIAVSAVGFTLHHVVVLGVFFPGRFWTLALPLSGCVGLGGAFWAWLYHHSGSLWAAWLSHALVDAAIMVVGYAMLRPYWLA
jgi:membrane protease YdiL (CAAX protease family)